MPEKKCIDDFLLFGRYGFLTAILIELVMVAECGNLLFMVFAGADALIITCDKDGTLETTPGSFHNDGFCSQFNTGTCKNPALQHDFYSVNVEWSLLCDRKQEVKDSTSYQMIGFLVGSIAWGRAADRFGRKRSMIISLIFTGLLGIASVFTHDIRMFTILRTLVSFFVISSGIVANTFFGEFFPSRHRLVLAYILNWSPNLLVVTTIAYFSQTWRVFAIVISLITFPAMLIMCYLDETPHYLLRSGKPEKSIEVIRRFHKINNEKLDLKELEEVFRDENQSQEKVTVESYSFLHLFCTPQLIGYTLATCFSNFQAGFISYSLLFNLEKITGSMYQNLLIVGTVRYAFNLLSAFAEYKLTWLGRKTTHRFFCAATILALSISIAGQLFDAPEFLARIFLLTTAAIIIQLFAVLGIICNEVFPTALRNTAYAFTMFIESIGPILAPHLYSISGDRQWLPTVIMLASVSIDLIVFTLAIPETRGKPLVDKMPDNEKRFRLFQDKKVSAITESLEMT